MKKLTKSVLAVVLSASFSVTYAQKAKTDTVKTKDIEGVVVTALGIKREKKKQLGILFLKLEEMIFRSQENLISFKG